MQNQTKTEKTATKVLFKCNLLEVTFKDLTVYSIKVIPLPEGYSRPRGGGGYYLIFSSYVGSVRASTIHIKKYQEFQALQKYLKF